MSPHLIDYHVHTDNSMDSKTPMAEMCARAIQLGLSEIAFTDHFNNHLLDIDLGFYDPERYFRDIEGCRAAFPGLTILAGIEVGEPHRHWRKAGPILERYPYDIVLGSVHWVGNHNMFHPRYYQSRLPEAAFRAYFAEVVRMVEHGGFDVLAHVDVVKRVGFDVYRQFDTQAFEADIRAIWQACIANRIMPEINTKSLRMAVRELHPAPLALGWYAEMGGTHLTFGSDAHRRDSLGDGIPEASAAARHTGLDQIARFRGRKVVDPVFTVVKDA
jgi:histidinol-phosphatase (PHP family)